MEVYCRAVPDLTNRKTHSLVRIVQILILITLSFHLFRLIQTLIWILASSDYSPTVYFWIRFSVCAVLLVLDIVWMVHPRHKSKNLLVNGTASPVDFQHQGAGNQYRYRTILIRNALMYNGRSADLRYLLPLANACKTAFTRENGQLNVSCDGGVRVIEQDGQARQQTSMRKINLCFFVTEEQAAKIVAELNGVISGPAAVESDPSVRHLTGDFYEWKAATEAVYQKEVKSGWRYQSILLTTKIYIPIAILCVVLEIFLTDYVSGGDVHPNLPAMLFVLALQIAILPVPLTLSTRGLPVNQYLQTLDITRTGLFGQLYTSRSRDSDNTEDENIRSMTARTTLQIPFQTLTGIEYDPELRNLRFTGSCTIRKENALSDSGKEAPDIRTHNGCTIHDYFRPSLAEVLREKGWDLRISRVKQVFPDALNGYFLLIDIFFVILVAITAQQEFFWSDLSPAAAIVILHVMGSIKKRKQPTN